MRNIVLSFPFAGYEFPALENNSFQIKISLVEITFHALEHRSNNFRYIGSEKDGGELKGIEKLRDVSITAHLSTLVALLLVAQCD